MNKQLKDIPSYQKIYAASKDGHIWSYKTNNFLSQSTDRYGYKIVHLIKDKDKKYLVHRLVALTWIPNPQNKPTVDHVDRNPSNNKIENLRWASYSEQSKNREWTGARQFVVEMATKEVSKPVEMRNKEDHSILIKTFDSCRKAAIEMFDDPRKNSLINRCANKKKKSAYGYWWCFKGQYK